jgi:hypothetical protein
MHRLNLSHKFLGLGMVALFMLVLPATLYFKGAVADIASAQREARGEPPLVALNKVIQLTQVHRGMSAAMLSGNTALEARRPALRDSVVKAMAALEDALKLANTSERLQAQWAQTKQRWAAVDQGVATEYSIWGWHESDQHNFDWAVQTDGGANTQLPLGGNPHLGPWNMLQGSDMAFQVITVPEPMTLLLVSLGLIGIVATRGRSRRPHGR